jgi:hypothetical protein
MPTRSATAVSSGKLMIAAMILVADDVAERIDVHGLQGVVLLADALNADFGAMAEPARRRDHDGREHRAQFHDERQSHRDPTAPSAPNCRQRGGPVNPIPCP